MRVLVTGANGFVGRSLCRRFLQDGRYEVVAAVRSEFKFYSGNARCVVGDISPQTSWTHAVSGIDAVVHLAGRAHVMHDTHNDPLFAYRSVNTGGTINLARQAALAGVKRFIFVSSIKVCGEGQSQLNEDAYTEKQSPSPSDAYAISKWEAERGLWGIAETTGLEVVVLRPPLVYGPGVGANFLRLMQTVDRGWPLPFGKINNCRDLIYMGNLVDAIATCVTHPAAGNKTFLLSDDNGVSTPELIRRVGGSLGRPTRLLPLPEKWLHLAGLLMGKQSSVDRLLSSLKVNSSAIRRELGWSPPYSMREGLAETAIWYRDIYGS